MAKRIRTAREMVIAGLHRGDTNEEIHARVRKAHPKSPMTTATINYLRNQVRKGDKTVKPNRVAKQKKRATL